MPLQSHTACCARRNEWPMGRGKMQKGSSSSAGRRSHRQLTSRDLASEGHVNETCNVQALARMSPAFKNITALIMSTAQTKHTHANQRKRCALFQHKIMQGRHNGMAA